MTEPPPRPAHRVDLSRVFTLENHGPDTYVGESPRYEWGRIFGGLVVAQALWAATQSVVPEHEVHSLHAYFILGGNPVEPIRYEVDRLRNGRSFSTRRVVARQSGGAILNLACSFQSREGGPESQSAPFPAGVPDPHSVTPYDEGSGTVRFDITVPEDPPRSLAWCRYPLALGADPRLHAAALAYISDANPMDAAVKAHPTKLAADAHWDDTFMSASLDHAVWFHRPVRADEWLLFDTVGHGIIGSRSLATGHVFDAAGGHIATIAQEGLVRLRRR